MVNYSLMDKKQMLTLRLEGRTYEYIANKAGVTRQRVQQLLSPPKAIRDFVVAKYNGYCGTCGLYVGDSGHVHHNPSNGEENYNDIENLELLCISCHRSKHPVPLNEAKTQRNENIRSYHAKHSKATLRAMGRMFHLSHVMIFKILKEKNNGR